MKDLLLTSLNANGSVVFRIIQEEEKIPRGFEVIDAVAISCPVCGEIPVKNGKVVLDGIVWKIVSAPKTWWRKL